MALTSKKKATILATLIVLLLFAGYIYYQARDFLHGPRIAITDPDKTSLIVDQKVLQIIGTAENVSQLTLNGAPISVDQYHTFSESLLLAGGFNIIEVTGTDRFNHRETRMRYIVYEPPEPPEQIATTSGEDTRKVSTSTPATTTTPLN